MVLASGSSGNCAILDTGRTRLLLDAGLSGRRIVAGLASMGLGPDQLDGVVITHEHGDHVVGLKGVLGRWAVPVYATAGTIQILRTSLPSGVQWRPFQAGERFVIGDVSIFTCPVPHDAMEPVALGFEWGGRRFGWITDLGYSTALLRHRFVGCDFLFVEANYDEVMLRMDTRRPWGVKQRIQNRHGHLSNEAAAELIRELAGPELREVCLGHLSRDCNQAQKVLEALQLKVSGVEQGRIKCTIVSQEDGAHLFRWMKRAT